MSSTLNPNSMYFYPTDQNEIDHIIKSIKNKKVQDMTELAQMF